jgi:hypothetical protein
MGRRRMEVRSERRCSGPGMKTRFMGSDLASPPGGSGSDALCYSSWVQGEISMEPGYAGLCTNCRHARRVQSDRGSVFFRCELALTDARFEKYPRLPVLVCAGYERKDDPSASAEPE